LLGELEVGLAFGDEVGFGLGLLGGGEIVSGDEVGLAGKRIELTILVLRLWVMRGVWSTLWKI